MRTRRYDGTVREAQLKLHAPQLHPGNVEEVELLAALLAVRRHWERLLERHPSYTGPRGPPHATERLVCAGDHMEIHALVRII